MKSRIYFKVRQHGQQQLYLQYKVFSILSKMVGTLSFSQPYLCIQPTLQSSPNTLSFTSVNFQLPIPALFVRKIIVKISTNTPFFYTSAQQSTPKRFYLNQPIQGTIELQGVLWLLKLFWSLPSCSIYGQW